MLTSNVGATTARRFTGRFAEEIAIHVRPSGQHGDVAKQAERAYLELAEALASVGASLDELVSESLFLRDVGRDTATVLDVRNQVLQKRGVRPGALLPTLVQQPPSDAEAALAISAHAVVAYDRSSLAQRDIQAGTPCPCAGCAGSGARLVELGGHTSLYSNQVFGVGNEPAEQARSMFAAAEDLLRRCDMTFKNVVRTWIHLRDIDRDYEALNAARRDFFQQADIALRPASTGVQAGLLRPEHDMSLSLHALRGPEPIRVEGLSTPTLNEAWSYGADFSRASRVSDGNKEAIHISGTASIDEDGRSVHIGNLEAQAERMLHNISSILAARNSRIEDAFSGIAYVREAADANQLARILDERGFEAIPCPIVVAPLCRPELLCETELLTLLPLADARA